MVGLFAEQESDKEAGTLVGCWWVNLILIWCNRGCGVENHVPSNLKIEIIIADVRGKFKTLAKIKEGDSRGWHFVQGQAFYVETETRLIKNSWTIIKEADERDKSREPAKMIVKNAETN